MSFFPREYHLPMPCSRRLASSGMVSAIFALLSVFFFHFFRYNVANRYRYGGGDSHEIRERETFRDNDGGHLAHLAPSVHGARRGDDMRERMRDQKDSGSDCDGDMLDAVLPPLVTW